MLSFLRKLMDTNKTPSSIESGTYFLAEVEGFNLYVRKEHMLKDLDYYCENIFKPNSDGPEQVFCLLTNCHSSYIRAEKVGNPSKSIGFCHCLINIETNYNDAMMKYATSEKFKQSLRKHYNKFN